MTGEDKKIIVKIISKYLLEAKIYLFGSRARQNHMPESDVDIALDNDKKIESYVLSLVKEEIDASTIPYTVDVIDMHAISENLKNQILKDGKLWH